MSTKTTFKRIALVAAASLGLGVLSIVPSQAAVSGLTVTITDGAATLQQSDSRNAATIRIQGTVDAGDSITVFAVPTTTPTATYRAFFLNLDSSTPNATNTTTVDTVGTTSKLVTQNITSGGMSLNVVTNPKSATDSALAAAVNNGTVMQSVRISATSSKYIDYTIGLQLDSTVARVVGTYGFNVTVNGYNASTGGVSSNANNNVADQIITKTANIVVTNAVTGTANTASGSSTALLYAGSAWASTNVDSTTPVDATANNSTARAVIRVTLVSSTGLYVQESITATTSLGTIGASGSAVTGRSIKITSDASGITDLMVYADGTSGTATITLSSTSVSFANKSLTFYNPTVAKIEGTKRLNTLAVGTNSGAITAVPTDSTGNLIPTSTSVYAYSSDLTVVNTGSTTGTACTYTAGDAYVSCSLTGVNPGTATITLRNKSTVALSTYTAPTTFTVTVSTQSPTSVKLSLDKATYNPGDKAFLTVTLLDKDGKIAPPGAYTNVFALGGISSNLQVGSSSDTTTAVSFTTAATGSTSTNSIEPVKVYTVYMPVSGGTMTFTATGGALLPTAGQVAVTASATIADSGASALAAVTALASQVSAFITKINAQITTLTDLVMKIQKKVKA